MTDGPLAKQKCCERWFVIDETIREVPCPCGVYCQDLRDGCRYRTVLEAIHEWHEAGEDPHELILRMIEVKHALGVEGFIPSEVKDG